ncbi:MAG: hypothetical protein N2505_00510 [Endomicrobia bacterium]|nr:hypothetical protein [Endomicrobiia bacterium]
MNQLKYIENIGLSFLFQYIQSQTPPDTSVDIYISTNSNNWIKILTFDNKFASFLIKNEESLDTSKLCIFQYKNFSIGFKLDKRKFKNLEFIFILTSVIISNIINQTTKETETQNIQIIETPTKLTFMDMLEKELEEDFKETIPQDTSIIEDEYIIPEYEEDIFIDDDYEQENFSNQ